MARDYLAEAVDLLHRVTHELEVLKDVVAEQGERITVLEAARQQVAEPPRHPLTPRGGATARTTDEIGGSSRAAAARRPG